MAISSCMHAARSQRVQLTRRGPLTQSWAWRPLARLRVCCWLGNPVSLQYPRASASSPPYRPSLGLGLGTGDRVTVPRPSALSPPPLLHQAPHARPARLAGYCLIRHLLEPSAALRTLPPSARKLCTYALSLCTYASSARKLCTQALYALYASSARKLCTREPSERESPMSCRRELQA